MPTHCNSDSLDFGSVEGRTIVAGFDGGTITSDAGVLLLGATDKAIRLIERFADAFTDGRDQDLIEHSVPTLVGQRVFGLALGYQDINDHDLLRHDPVLAALMGKMTARRKECAALAGKSTLNRLEHAPEEGEHSAPNRYHKISHDGAKIDRLFVDQSRAESTR
jgi:Transposase DDE domain group 1